MSSDDTRAIVSVRAPGRLTRDLWVFDLAQGGLRTRLTLDDADYGSPIWSPDDARIVFGSNRKNRAQHNLSSKASSMTGGEDVVLEDSGDKAPSSWSPDNRFILYRTSASSADLWVLPLFGDRKPFPFANNTKFSEDVGSFSPDGHWIAYRSNESGSQPEIYVAPFPGPGKKTRISPTGAGGTSPRWRRDGKELFYVSSDNQLMVAEVNSIDTSFTVTNVRPLFDSRARAGALGERFDVSGDGQRFLINMGLESAAPLPITLVVNWTVGLKK